MDVILVKICYDETNLHGCYVLVCIENVVDNKVMQ